MVDVMSMEQMSYFNTETLAKGDTVSLITKDLLKQNMDVYQSAQNNHVNKGAKDIYTQTY